MSTKPEENIHIGIDFDNTIVKYDNAFYHQALKRGLIDKGTMKNKQAIRDAIRRLPHGNDKWTQLQGIMYGLHMDEAQLIEGIGRFLLKCKKEKVRVSVISQKTIYPAMGPRVNLQDSARRWLENNKFISKYGLSEKDIVFEETIAGKIARIMTKGCTHFIDDLPEILLNKDFPEGVERILFSRAGECADSAILCFRDWDCISKYFFPAGNDHVRRAAEGLINRATRETIVDLRALSGAFNCSVFKAVTDKGNKYLVKEYHMKNNDNRDRLATEYGGLSFLWNNGIRNIPRPISADKRKDIAVYSFVDGKKVRGNDIKLNDIRSAAKILGAMRRLSSRKHAAEQPIASEACFSIQSYIDIVGKRMKRLKLVKRGVPASKEMLRFVRTELEPFFIKVKKFIAQNSTRTELDRKLTGKEKFLSPSDVGFHNILKGKNGRLFFIDFEYYGWDDPAKTISDFFLQPDSPTPLKFRRDFFDKVSGYFGQDRRLARRLPLVYAVLSVKWCQIMLNVFLGENIRDRIVFEKQLKKAKRKLGESARELKELAFPLSLVNEVN